MKKNELFLKKGVFKGDKKYQNQEKSEAFSLRKSIEKRHLIEGKVS